MDPDTLRAVREAVEDLRRQAKAPPNGDLADLVAARVGSLDDVLEALDELEDE